MTPRFFYLAFAFALSALCGSAVSQEPAKVPVVAILVTHAAVDDPIFDSLRAGLRKLGYEAGRNIQLEIVTAEGQLERLPGLAAEMVRRRVDLIVAPNDVSTRVAMKATGSIPIVMAGTQGYDPVALGLIESFHRPGGNVTGMYGQWSEMEAKRLELVKELLPRTSLVAVFWEGAFGRSALADLQRNAQRLGMRLEPIEIASAGALDPAFKTAKRKKVGAIVTLSSPVFYTSRARIGALGVQTKIPVVSPINLGVEAGALMSYGPDIAEGWVRTAYYVDRVLKGAKPSDLPVEQVSNFKLAVNLKTAKALGITIPQSILIRADEVIR
jgi:putative ABC transport system substrate-binding protein